MSMNAEGILEPTLSQILQGHYAGVNGIAFSSDYHGTRLASVSDDWDVRVWDVTPDSYNEGQCIQIFKGHIATVLCVCWNPDSSLIASGSHDNTIRLWYTELNGGLDRKIVGPSPPSKVLSLDWNVDGTKIVAGYSAGTTLRLFCMYIHSETTFHYVRKVPLMLKSNHNYPFLSGYFTE